MFLVVEMGRALFSRQPKACARVEVRPAPVAHAFG
jgi:hypothetical protein